MVTIAAEPVRCRRPTGFLRNEECSHTPVRTAGSASSRMTAAKPPMKSARGFLKMRHDTEWGPTRASSPGGREKSMAGPCRGFKNAPAAAASLRCKLHGSRMMELVGCIPRRSVDSTALRPVPGDQRRQPAEHLANALGHRYGQRQFAADAECLSKDDQAGFLYAEPPRHDEGQMPHGLSHALERQGDAPADRVTK